MTIESKSEQLEKLQLLKESAQECLDSLRDILKTIEPGIMKSTRVNAILEQEKSRNYRRETEHEIAYYESVIEHINKKIGELNDNQSET